MTDERIFEQDDLRGMTPAEIVDEVAALRAERDQWRESAGRLALLLRENVDSCRDDDRALCDDGRGAPAEYEAARGEGV